LKSKAPIKRKQTNFKLENDDESDKTSPSKPAKVSAKAQQLAKKARESFSSG